MSLNNVALKDLAHINELNLMKMVFSSGDYFPGFYRYTLGTQKVGDESLSLNTLVWLYFEQKMTGRHHSREDWIDLQHEIHERDVASDSARNSKNFPDVRKLLSERMMDWYVKASGFDIIYLDTEREVESFEEGKSYYFMGSILRYKENKFHISYNDLTNTSAFELAVSFESIESYLNSIFCNDDFKSLFLHAETIAILKFDDADLGKLEMNEDFIDNYLTMNSETKVFAAPVESRDLPMRYAKSIRLTNFKRGEDGNFQVWQSDQNW